VPEDSHDLNQPNGTHDSGDYADKEFDADKAPRPIEASIGEE
jgi:hypothetical protein